MERDIIAVASAAVKHCSTTMQLDRQNFPFFLFSAWYSDLQGVFKLFDLVGPNGTERGCSRFVPPLGKKPLFGPCRVLLLASQNQYER